MLTRIRMGLRMGRGSRVLRNSRKVTHRIQAIRDEEQALALEAETHTLKSVGAAAVAGLGVVAAAGATLGAAGGIPEIAIPVAAGGFLLGSSAIVLGVKVWLSRVKDALRRALDGVSSPDVMEGGDPLERQLLRLRKNIKQARAELRGRNRWTSRIGTVRADPLPPPLRWRYFPPDCAGGTDLVNPVHWRHWRV